MKLVHDGYPAKVVKINENKIAYYTKNYNDLDVYGYIIFNDDTIIMKLPVSHGCYLRCNHCDNGILLNNARNFSFDDYELLLNTIIYHNKDRNFNSLVIEYGCPGEASLNWNTIEHIRQSRKKMARKKNFINIKNRIHTSFPDLDKLPNITGNNKRNNTLDFIRAINELNLLYGGVIGNFNMISTDEEFRKFLTNDEVLPLDETINLLNNIEPSETKHVISFIIREDENFDYSILERINRPDDFNILLDYIEENKVATKNKLLITDHEKYNLQYCEITENILKLGYNVIKMYNPTSNIDITNKCPEKSSESK